jgi:hypothetical protein
MKLKLIAVLILSTFVMWGFAASQALAGTDYNARYTKQIKTNDSIRAAIKQAVGELNKLHYKSYPQAMTIMQDAVDQIGYADKMRKKTEKLARMGKWKSAFGWSGMELQYLIKAVVKARVVRNLIKSKNKVKNR